jgi:hypothetical protein
LKCNPIAAKNSYRPTVFQRITGLVKLDGIALTDKDKERVKNDHIILTREIITDAIKGATNVSKPAVVTQPSNVSASVGAINAADSLKTMGTSGSQQSNSAQKPTVIS